MVEERTNAWDDQIPTECLYFVTRDIREDPILKRRFAGLIAYEIRHFRRKPGTAYNLLKHHVH